MAKGLPRTLGRVLIGLALAALVLSSLYAATSSLSGTFTNPGGQYRYSNANETSVDAQAVQQILNSLAQSMNASDLSQVHAKLNGLTSLPANRTDPLEAYLANLSTISDNMANITATLQEARLSITSGNRNQASTDLGELQNLRSGTRLLLNFSNALLSSIGNQYGIGTTTQQQKVAQINAAFQTYSGQIDQLAAELSTQQGLIPTTLDINASNVGVFIDQNLSFSGFLKLQNGTALSNRNITISWGINQTLLKRTDSKGRVQGNVSFPIGFPSGLTQIEAEYTPQGKDAAQYLPSSALLTVEVTYRPTNITAAMYPANVKPLDHATVIGSLSIIDGLPLQFRTITFQLNGTSIGNATTGNTGAFAFPFQVPRSLGNGTHILDVAFPAAREQYAPSNTTVQFTVEIIGTQTHVSIDRGSILSGMNILMNGSVTYANGTIPRGENVTIFLDNFTIGNATISGDGSFLSVIRLPIWSTFGSHSIKAEYISNHPWIQSSQSVTHVFGYSTPLIILIALAIATASSIGFYIVRRRRATMLPPVAMPQPVSVETHSRQETSPKNLIAAVQEEMGDAARIRRAYVLALGMINQKLGESPWIGETHREYLLRVTKSIPKISDTFKHLTEVYELVEYSPYAIEPAESREATKLLLELREEIETVN